MTERGVEWHCGLPADISSLVGRGPQLAAVLDGLRASRMVTLTGPGGCGKTRLALRAATLAAGGFEDGARLVELASLTDPALVPTGVAEALGVPERDAADPVAGVVRALAGRELLIVLDNCEHVLGSAGRVVVMLAGQCRRVRVMATSRERLDVPGEFVFPVPPLGLPEDGSVRAVAASEAGSLFVARARAASPAFALTAGNAAAIADVCSRLDGMPLAIELAAARCPALGPVQLAARLEGHPGLLSGGAARPGRHRSLEALVAWSYDLLGDDERRLLARLSVLRGGFGLEVAERVCGGEPLAPQAVAACWPAWPASRWCRSRPARWSAIRCWRPSASSPPGGWPPPARKPRCTPACCSGRLKQPGRRRRPCRAPRGPTGPVGYPPTTPASAPRCPGRSAAPSRRRDGNWPPGSPDGGSPPAGTAKQASS